MQHFITSFILSLVFMGSIYAQEEKTIYIIDGYTLEPLTGFEAISTNEKITFRTDLNTIITDKAATGSLTISKEGYETSTFDLNGTEDQNFIIRPTQQQIAFLREKYAVSATPEISVKTVSSSYTTIKTPEDETASEPEKLETMDIPAQFPGGNSALSRFLGSNIRYPEAEVNYGIEGKVYCKFMVDEDGTLSNITIAKGLTKNIELETLRVLNIMPKWTPAMREGKPVKSYFTLPVNFKLQ